MAAGTSHGRSHTTILIPPTIDPETGPRKRFRRLGDFPRTIRPAPRSAHARSAAPETHGAPGDRADRTDRPWPQRASSRAWQRMQDRVLRGAGIRPDRNSAAHAWPRTPGRPAGPRVALPSATRRRG